MSEVRAISSPGPGRGTLWLLLAVTAMGAMAFMALSVVVHAEWAQAALPGWLIAGVLGVSGWWAARKALRDTDGKVFIKYVLGGMAVRQIVALAVAMVVIATNALDPVGFVVGLLGGFLFFLIIEIGGLMVAARRVATIVAEGAASHVH
jgi:hypothetical protein